MKTTYSITLTAILTSIIFVAMALLSITVFQSSLHLGSLLIVVISLVFPRKQAAVASAVGPTLFDLFAGWGIYAPFTFVARLLLSLIVSTSKDKSIFVQILTALLGGIVVIIIYFISNLIFLKSFNASMAAAIPDVIQLLLTVAGVFIARPISLVVKELS